MSAAAAALMRWYPNTSLGDIDLSIRLQPGYPLIHGGQPKPDDADAALVAAEVA